VKPTEYFRSLATMIPQLETDIMSDVISVEAEAFHAKNFRDEGFTDRTLTKWQRRKKPDASRALLVKTSKLKGHALRGKLRGRHVDFVMPAAYMRVHNDGGKAGRGKGFQMPKRQYLGESQYLNDRIKRKAIAVLNHRFKDR
jgi:phage gpG-like protein